MNSLSDGTANGEVVVRAKTDKLSRCKMPQAPAHTACAKYLFLAKNTAVQV